MASWSVVMKSASFAVLAPTKAKANDVGARSFH
jgi:hypothetical protein